MPLLHGSSRQHTLKPLMEERHMRKLIIALMISAALIVSGISATTFTSGQFTSSASADGGCVTTQVPESTTPL